MMAALQLLLLVSLAADGGVAQSTSYSSWTPPPPPPPQTDHCDNDYDFTTQYVTFFSNTGDSHLIDNYCETLFRTDDKEDNYISYMSKVFHDGSSEYTTNIVQYNRTTGHITVATPNCLSVTNTVGTVGNTTIYRRRIVGGACRYCDGTPSVYPLVGGSPCPQPLTSRELSMIRQLIRSSAYIRAALIS